MSLREVDGKIVEEDGRKPFVEFYEHAKKVGKGKFKPVIFIKIKTVGMRDFMSRLATDNDKASYPEAWEAFQGGQSREEGQTALSMLPSFRTAFGLELQVRGVNSIETLAAIPEPVEPYLREMWLEANDYLTLQEMKNERRKETEAISQTA